MATPALSTQQITDLHLLMSKGYDISYKSALSAKENWLPRMAYPVTSDTHPIHFPFSFPTVGMNRTPLGGTVAHQRALTQYVDIDVAKFSNGFEILINDFADPIIQQMAMEQVSTLPINWVYSPLYRACDALRLGDSDPYYVSYDGQQIFSTTHTVNTPGYSWSNLKSGKLWDPTDAGATFNEVKSNMRMIPWGPNGKFLPMNGARWVIMVPPKQEVNAKKLVENTWYLQNNLVGDNPYSMTAQNIAEVIVEENLVTQADPDNMDWYVIALLPQAAIMPFIWAEQNVIGSGALVSNIDLAAPNMYWNDTLQWKLQGFMEVFPGQFFLITKIIEVS